MRNHRSCNTRLHKIFLAGACTFSLAGALAQDAQDTARDIANQPDEILEEIVTTGSAIKREDLNNALPIQVIDHGLRRGPGLGRF